jgi:hypothetical protein
MSKRPARTAQGDNSSKRQNHYKQTQTSKVAAATAVAINHGGGDRHEKRKIEDREGKELDHKRIYHKTPAAM